MLRCFNVFGCGGPRDLVHGMVARTLEDPSASRSLRPRFSVCHIDDVIDATIALAGALIGRVAVVEAGGSEREVFDDVHVYYDTTSLLVQLGLA